MSTAVEAWETFSKALRDDDDSYFEGAPAGARARSRKRRDEGAAAKPEPLPEQRKFSRPNGEDYIARMLEGLLDVELYRQARASALPVLLYGPPGTGKTAGLEAAFHDQPGGIFTVSGSSDTERADFIGGYVQSPGGNFEWVDGPLIEAMEAGGVLFIDEIALIDPKVMSVVYSVMDGRNTINVTENPERGVVTSAPGFYVVGACNPNVPGARMSEALVSRFTVQAEYGTDYDLAKSLGVPNKFVIAARNLEKKRAGGEMSWAPQMRECLAFAKVHATFGEAVALRNMVAVAPEIDRDDVAETLSNTFGTTVEALKAS